MSRPSRVRFVVLVSRGHGEYSQWPASSLKEAKQVQWDLKHNFLEGDTEIVRSYYSDNRKRKGDSV